MEIGPSGPGTAIGSAVDPGIFQAITALLVYDDQGRGYPYGLIVEEAFDIRPGVAIRAAASLGVPSPEYRDWVVGDDGTVAVVSTVYPSAEPRPTPEVGLIRDAGEHLYGVTQLGDFAWAVGAKGSVIRCDTTECEDVVIPSLPEVTLRDVAVIGDILYMVGDKGTILSYSPDSGYLVDSSDTRYGNLVSVAGFNDGDLRQPILVLSTSGAVWRRSMPAPN